MWFCFPVASHLLQSAIVQRLSVYLTAALWTLSIQRFSFREGALTGRRGRRRKQLLDDLKEKWGYGKLEEKTLYHSLCRTRFERGYWPVVRKTADWINYYSGPLPWQLIIYSSYCLAFNPLKRGRHTVYVGDPFDS